MAEYIERDSLVGKLIEMKYCSTSSKIDFVDVIRLINSEPTADVQEVVRCKDCRWSSTEECAMYYRCNCGEQHTWESDNDFCSYGERKDCEQE